MGGTAVPPANPTRTGFAFSGWNPATFTNITATMTVKAQYTSNAPVQVAGVNTAIGITENPNKYTVIFTLAADNKAKILTVVLPEGAIASVWYTVSSMTQTGQILTITVAKWQSSPAIYVTYSGAAAHTAIVTSIGNG